MYSLADSLAHASLSLLGPSYTKAIKTRQLAPSLVSSFRPVSKKIELCHRRVSKCSVEKTVAPDLVWCTGASCCCQPPASARCGRMSENPVIFWWIRGSLRTTRDQVCTPAIINRPSHHSVLIVGFIKKLAAVQKDAFSKVSIFGANLRVCKMGI